MRKILVGLSFVFLLVSCQESQHVSLDANTFIESVKDNKDIQLIDTRTPAEYDHLHMYNAINIDFNNPNWKNELSKLDKNRPVYLYCLSGSRSIEMMNALKEEGFDVVYNLEGGLAKLEENQVAQVFDLESLKKKNSALGMNQEQLAAFVSEHKNVVVDFYADWCGPCRAMDPHLKELAENNKDKFTLLKINFDHSKELANVFKIKGIPHILLYKDGQLVDQQSGFSLQYLEQFKQNILAPYK